MARRKTLFNGDPAMVGITARGAYQPPDLSKEYPELRDDLDAMLAKKYPDPESRAAIVMQLCEIAWWFDPRTGLEIDTMPGPGVLRDSLADVQRLMHELDGKLRSMPLPALQLVDAVIMDDPASASCTYETWRSLFTTLPFAEMLLTQAIDRTERLPQKPPDPRRDRIMIAVLNVCKRNEMNALSVPVARAVLSQVGIHHDIATVSKNMKTLRAAIKRHPSKRR